ncbi:uncharacterized protein LAJ45_11464 [Morchella importuna]|uniref:uncharacterized protein n=1 Tax=Morchella importuna TaxID=1174673 RepID=UPI001E8EB681|nr:uncharacterized protein LAJ45_11464 [Morchella importuna]KAH8144524.1 hypothetical protein LAJ45_11464 [Morchella importuna]
MFIYACWWSKPLDVDEPVKITLRKDGNTPPDFTIPGVLQAQVKASKKYSRLNHLVTKLPCPGSIAIKSKAFFDLVTYIYSEGIKVASPERKKKTALYGVVGMVVEGSLVVLVGGLHLLAWNVYFPSAIESLLWKACSFGMILFPSIVVFIASFTRYERDLFPILWRITFKPPTHRGLLGYGIGKIHGICTKHARKSAGLPQKPSKLDPEEPPESGPGEPPQPKPSLSRLVYYGLLVLMHYALVYLCLLSLLCYALSTTFIVVESYISMRDPPPGAFKTPRWSDYWPHL